MLIGTWDHYGQPRVFKALFTLATGCRQPVREPARELVDALARELVRKRLTSFHQPKPHFRQPKHLFVNLKGG